MSAEMMPGIGDTYYDTNWNASNESQNEYVSSELSEQTTSGILFRNIGVYAYMDGCAHIWIYESAAKVSTLPNTCQKYDGIGLYAKKKYVQRKCVGMEWNRIE